MLRDGPSHHIKNLLLHAVPALNGTAVRTIPIRIVNEVFELLRVNCHDFFRRINRNSRKVLPRSRGSRPSRELPRGAASGVSKQVILGLTAGSIMPVDRKANDSVGYFGKMPYSGYFGSPFSVGCVGYFGRNLPRQITKLPRRFSRSVERSLQELFKCL